MEVRLSREMRLIDITMIGVGAMIGAGIFVLTGIAAGVAGPALILVFLLNGVVAALTAMAYAELGSAFHDAGGGYLWVKHALPDPNGFLSGWMSWFAHAVACSLYALGFGAYFRLVLTAFHVPEFQLGFMTLEKWLAAATVVLFAWINYRGASETGKAGNVVTIGKVAIILALIVAGLAVMFGRPDWQAAFHPFVSHGWSSVFVAMGLTFIAFEGYEIIAQTSEEVQDPKRNVPRAMFLSLLIVVPIYLLVAWVAVGATIPPAGMEITQYLGQQKEIALVRAADQFVRGGGVILMVGGLLSTLSALNATIYSSSRVAFAMARDANLPPALGEVHERRATPHYAIAVSAVIILVMAVALPIEAVAAAADIMFLLLFMQVNVAVVRLRKQRPDLDRGFTVPFLPLTPILAIVTMAFLAFFLLRHYPLALISTAIWVALGLVLYYTYSRKREAAFVEREEWMERIERKEYRVLVALANPQSVASLLEAALAIAQFHNGEIVALAVAEVPEGESLMAGRKRARALEPLLNQAMQYAADKGCGVLPVVRIAHRVSQGILETVREEECNFLVMGRPDTQSVFEKLVASVTELVLRDAPCQVGVVFGTLRPSQLNGVLLPVTTGDNSLLAASLAPAFAARYGGRFRAVTVVERGAEDEDVETQTAEARATLDEAGLEVELEVLRRREVGRGLAFAARRGELVLMGAPRGGPVAAILGASVPDTVARRGRNPVVVVREVEEHRARRFERVFFARS